MARWVMNHPPKVSLDMSEEAIAKRKAIKAKRYANWFAKLTPGEQKGIIEARERHAKGVAEGLWDRRGKPVKK